MTVTLVAQAPTWQHPFAATTLSLGLLFIHHSPCPGMRLTTISSPDATLFVYPHSSRLWCTGSPLVSNSTIDYGLDGCRGWTSAECSTLLWQTFPVLWSGQLQSLAPSPAQHNFGNDVAQLLSQLDKCIRLSRKLYWCCNWLWKIQAGKWRGSNNDPRYCHGHVLPWIPPAYDISLKIVKHMRMDLIEILRQTVVSLKAEDST
ncbi:hypothetical protein IW262DRAFT_1069397 [Armillaria fumosa]|nr:hypothetical protein IW262DRAFT_1069397 [Armillaria fumosa]